MATRDVSVRTSPPRLAPGRGRFDFDSAARRDPSPFARARRRPPTPSSFHSTRPALNARDVTLNAQGRRTFGWACLFGPAHSPLIDS